MKNKEAIAILSQRPEEEFGFVYTGPNGRETLVCPARLDRRYVVGESPFFTIEDARTEMRNIKSLYRLNGSSSNVFIKTVTVASE